MKTKNLKTEVISQSEKKIQKVEMIVYFVNGTNDLRLYEADFKIDDVIHSMDDYYENPDRYEGFRNKLYLALRELSLDPEPSPTLYSFMISYIISNDIIQEGIKKYPMGGTAIIAHINVLDESQSSFQFFDPKTFKDHKKKDYSIITFKEENTLSLSKPEVFELTREEVLFLLILINKIKQSDHYCCNFSNEEILENFSSQKRFRNCIPENLGKLLYYKIIGIDFHTSNGSTWFRDIYITDCRWFGSKFINGNKLSA